MHGLNSRQHSPRNKDNTQDSTTRTKIKGNLSRSRRVTLRRSAGPRTLVPNSEGVIQMLNLVGYSRAMSDDVARWELLADLVRTARDVLGMTSQGQLAEAAGVAVGTVQRLEGGKPYPRLPNRTPAIERALYWPAGTVRKIIEGEISLPPVQAIPAPSSNGENSDAAREALEMARTLHPEDEQAYRDALAAARSLSRAEKRRLLAELFDDAGPVAMPSERHADPH